MLVELAPALGAFFGASCAILELGLAPWTGLALGGVQFIILIWLEPRGGDAFLMLWPTCELHLECCVKSSPRHGYPPGVENT